ncbi:hypothetical protein RJ639_013229 [Escallonia herrerae]|uniref:FAD-binding domain-containing protein n=1 Tax=Escallonia herrerae TaxID=1293975 RepID=A0AA89AQA7_9ASTE|nr:hypothetical protein RJ639_013229 [Escallonia herrerae]
MSSSLLKEEMKEEDIVIVGAGIAGLATSLGLHRLGLRSLVLESSDNSRSTGFALTLWTNAWRALDAVGIGDSLRQRSVQLRGRESEARCVERKDLLGTLVEALPRDTVRYSSKVVSIEESGPFKLVHLSDGTILKTKADDTSRLKVLIGCDGINSSVANWLGLQKPGDQRLGAWLNSQMATALSPSFLCTLEEVFALVSFHAMPSAYIGFAPTHHLLSNVNDEDMEKSPVKMKQFVLNNVGKLPQEVSNVVERTELDSISSAQMKFRLPWNVLLGDIIRDNVCVAGDALHPMTPDLGQGGCSALEDSVILARYLAKALLTKPRAGPKEEEEEEISKDQKGFGGLRKK